MQYLIENNDHYKTITISYIYYAAAIECSICISNALEFINNKDVHFFHNYPDIILPIHKIQWNQYNYLYASLSAFYVSWFLIIPEHIIKSILVSQMSYENMKKTIEDHKYTCIMRSIINISIPFIYISFPSNAMRPTMYMFLGHNLLYINNVAFALLGIYRALNILIYNNK